MQGTLTSFLQLGRAVDATRIELSLHQLVCGRHRKNIKLIESSTGTAIYFPPLFSQMYRYCPQNATRRDPADIFITGETPQAIELAKQKLHESVSRIRLYVKDVTIPAAKIDCILLDRLDKVRKILETNGTYIMFPPLACQRTMVRVQGCEGLPVERTVRELMSLVRCFTLCVPPCVIFADLPFLLFLQQGWTILRRWMVLPTTTTPPSSCCH